MLQHIGPTFDLLKIEIIKKSLVVYMQYFRITNKKDEIFIHFFNRRFSIYSSQSKPNLLKELKVDPNEFVDKANSLFAKYKINIPKNYPKHGTLETSFKNKKVDDFPIYDFLICIHCCIIMEEKYGLNTSKLLRWELIKPNSNRGIYHACSMAVIALFYLEEGFEISIPLENKNELNPDLIINDFRCEVKTIQQSDWESEIDPDTGFGKRKYRGPDICYDIGKFIEKEDSGYKGILQGEVIFADLTLKSFGEVSGTLIGLGFGDKLKYGLPELKKCRIIFFSRHYLNCVGYFIDFEPRLWNLIDLASGMEYQRAVFSFTVPGNGKPHKITLPSPPPNDAKRSKK